MMKNHDKKIALAHSLMEKYGSFVIFVQKYIYGIKTLIPLAIGITEYSVTKFTIFNAIATALWSCVIGYASFTAGEYLLKLGDDFKYVGIFTIVMVILAITYFVKKVENK
jgi:membrane protein DedA with SNARE-associated domain